MLSTFEDVEHCDSKMRMSISCITVMLDIIRRYMRDTSGGETGGGGVLI